MTDEDQTGGSQSGVVTEVRVADSDPTDPQRQDTP
jgi:hypothetical protein